MTLRTSEYRPSAELTSAINGLLQQDTASEDEQKPIPYPLRACSPLVLNHAINLKSSTKQEEKHGWKTFRYVIQLLRDKNKDEQACTATKRIKLEEA